MSQAFILMVGNHIFNILRIYMDEVSKNDGDDGSSMIENDISIGSNAILSARGRDLTTGEGSIIATSLIVTKDVEPYTVVAGVPA